MAVVFTYGDLTLDGSEVTTIKMSKVFQITTLNTIQSYEISQAGILNCNRFDVDCIFRNNAGIKLVNWYTKIASKPSENLIVWSRTWGNYYLEKVSISSADMAEDKDLLMVDMSLSFIETTTF